MSFNFCRAWHQTFVNHLQVLLLSQKTSSVIDYLQSETSLDGDNALGFSSGLETKSVRVSGDDALDDGNWVRFRLPSGSSNSSNPGYYAKKNSP
jgi:hypothetical protein